MPDRITIPVRGTISVTALRTRAKALPARWRFVYAPGAGSNLHDPFGVYLAQTLPVHGIDTWRFQFPYMETGRKAPDTPALLEDTWRAVIDAASRRAGLDRLVIGGRSMGGRIASQVVAQGMSVGGLALFAYPLAPPGRDAAPRSAHLPSIDVPTLFVSGTRDTFGTPEQLTEATALVPGASLHLLDGADHGFAVLKASGRSREQVWQEATKAFLDFVERLG